MIIQTENPVFEIHDLTVTYDRKPILWDIDLSLPEGVLAGIIGPNGAGKTTMLRAAMGLIPVNSGYIEMYGKPLNEVRHRVSYVPQRRTVDWDFPASVFDVVLMGTYPRLGLFRYPRKAEKELAMQAIRKVGLEDYKHRQISQLSGGQQQRVFLARALAQHADMFLLDEPFAGVDAATEIAILSILQEMCAQGKTVIVVHHDLQSVSRYFDWTIMIHSRLIASGPTEDIFTKELIEKTYGSKLNLLSEVGDMIQRDKLPIREKK
ncbi:MAG: metal ABC transporter ATP-binding protein [Cyclobacteriaceae bacterium]